MDRIKPWLPWLIGLGLILSIALIFLGGDEETAAPTPTASAVVTATATPIIATPTETESTEALPTETETEAADPATATTEPPTATATAEPPMATPTPTPTSTPSTAVFEESGVSLEYPVALGIENIQLQRIPAQILGTDGPPNYFTDVPEFLAITFDTPQGTAELFVRPIRNGTGAFYASQPATLTSYFTTFEAQIAAEGEGRLDQQQLAYLDFGSEGRGLRAISYLLETPGPAKITNERLYYFFDGFSTGGRYYVTLTYPVSAPGLAESGEFTAEELAEVTADYDAYAQETLLPLADLGTADFTPDLALIDELVQSIVVDDTASTQISIFANDPNCTNDAAFVRDVTIPDGEPINRGERFTKIWEVVNTGTCTWTPAYTATFNDGDDLGWRGFVAINGVPPGQTFQIAVDLVGPDVPGIYEGRWQMIDGRGQPFGVLVYVTIVVPETPVVRTPTATPLVPATATPVPAGQATPTPRPVLTPQAKTCTDDLTFVRDVTVDDGSAIDPGQRFAKTWEVSGGTVGTPCIWGESYALQFVDGTLMGWDGTALVTRTGALYQISINLVGPPTPGVYQGRWQMTNEFGQPFGQIIYLAIVVPEQE